jgi:dihydroorotase
VTRGSTVTVYDLVVKGGRVVDPAQSVDEVLDVAIARGRIVELRRGIRRECGRRVVDATDAIVLPGLVDLHVHCCRDLAPLAVDPETACLGRGSTTVLDAGSTGHLTFPGFSRYVIGPSQTRIYALLNIESLGMLEGSRERWPTLIPRHEAQFINVADTVAAIRRNRERVRGVKWAHHTPTGLRLAREAADAASCLLMAENHYEPTTVQLLRRGDVVTHAFHAHRPSLRRRPGDGLLDGDGHVHPEMFDAKKRGVVFDVGHGSGSFAWRVAEAALEQGIAPDTISTDLHMGSVNGPAYDMLTTMAKFLLLGLSLRDVVAASTRRPAEVLGLPDAIGTLRYGADADLVVVKREEGRYAFTDVDGAARTGRQRLRLLAVVKSGARVA